MWLLSARPTILWESCTRNLMSNFSTRSSTTGCGSDLVDGAQRSISILFVERVSESQNQTQKMARFLIDITGETGKSSISNAVVSGCWRRPVVHQRTSVLSELYCSLLGRIQLETTPMHSESFVKNASTSHGSMCYQHTNMVRDSCLRSVTSDQWWSAVYKINNWGTSSDPWGIPHVCAPYLLCSTKQMWLKPPVNFVMMPKVTCKRWIRIS